MPAKRVFPVVGMACASCAANVERHLNSMAGVDNATVSLAGRTVVVVFDPGKVTPGEMKRCVNAIGYDLVIEDGRSAEEIERRGYSRLVRHTILSWLLSILGMSVSMGWIAVGGMGEACQLAMLLAFANMFFCGRGFYEKAAKQLCARVATMDLLVALSTTITFLYSAYNTFWGNVWGDVCGSDGAMPQVYFDSCGMIITFVLTGRLIEEKAKDGTATSIRRLMSMAPKTARLIVGSEVREVPISTICAGDILEVRAGDKIPVDGEVVSAESFMTADAAYVDESMLTGEPMPAMKAKGSRVLAGTLPSQGSLRMRARQVGADTALARIIGAVREAEASKAPVQRIVDKAVAVFVPVVAVIAVVTFAAWLLISLINTGSARLPEAIASAVTVMVVACPCAMGLATPTAIMVGVGKAADEHVLIKDATALERLRQADVLVTDKTGTLTIPNTNVDFTQSDGLAPMQRENLKPNAREAIDALRRQGIEVWLMSGDNEEAVRYWAGKAGINNFKAQCHPDDKQSLVEKLKSEGKTVAMLGDGINDTQALASADISIAIGTGTDVAMDVAQVTLLTDDLLALPRIVQLSRATTRAIWQNLFWAFAYNLVCIPVAAGVLHLFYDEPPFQLTPMWGSALMALSGISVVLNSLRLKKSLRFSGVAAKA